MIVGAILCMYALYLFICMHVFCWCIRGVETSSPLYLHHIGFGESSRCVIPISSPLSSSTFHPSMGDRRLTVYGAQRGDNSTSADSSIDGRFAIDAAALMCATSVNKRLLKLLLWSHPSLLV